MAFAKNAQDGVRIYHEDLGGPGPAVVAYGGLTQSTEQLHTWPLVQALEGSARLILADHRGHGQSDKPHDQASYTAALKAADFVAVLEALGLEKAHVLGYSWGARLGFCIGEHHPERVSSLILGGHQPYAFRRDGPVVKTMTEALQRAREGGISLLAEHFEAGLGRRLPEDVRAGMLQNDAHAVHAAWNAALDEGNISRDLTKWDVACLIYVADGDVDFYADAERAAKQIPNARFLSLPGLNHVSGHGEVLRVLRSILEMLRE